MNQNIASIIVETPGVVGGRPRIRLTAPVEILALSSYAYICLVQSEPDFSLTSAH